MIRLGKDAPETHVGLVLATRERNFRDDSDFYALVWNPEAKKVESVEYATTRFYTYDNVAVEDATPEAWAGARRQLAGVLFERALRRDRAAARKVEVVNPERYETPESELRERAERHAARAESSDFASAFSSLAVL